MRWVGSRTLLPKGGGLYARHFYLPIFLRNARIEGYALNLGHGFFARSSPDYVFSRPAAVAESSEVCIPFLRLVTVPFSKVSRASRFVTHEIVWC